MNELVLSLDHVYSGYSDGAGPFGRRTRQEVLHDVTFDVRHGEILGLVGERHFSSRQVDVSHFP